MKTGRQPSKALESDVAVYLSFWFEAFSHYEVPPNELKLLKL